MNILILGSTGFVGRWVVDKTKLFKPTAKIIEASLSLETDLRDRVKTFELFEQSCPDQVINCAAFVGGIQYGYDQPAKLFSDNTQMILNIFEASREYEVKRLVQPISNCAYPGEETYFSERNFWHGPMHESVLAYGMTRKMMSVGAWAYAKQYGLDTISLILSNMYGPGDHFEEARSHALGAMVKKIVDAKFTNDQQVVIWGTGKPVREWLYVEDGAEALVRALDIEPYVDIINVGIGEGISVRDLAELIKEIVGWNGELVFDSSKPDGAPHKTVDGSRGVQLLGWGPQTPLQEGIKKTVEYYTALRSTEQ